MQEEKVKVVILPKDTVEYPSDMWQLGVFQHLYILGEKAPKFGGYYYSTKDSNWYKISESCLSDLEDGDKEILATTDPELIANGVPSIDEDFIKEFVRLSGKGKVTIRKYDWHDCNEIPMSDEWVENHINKLIVNFSTGNAILSIEPEKWVPTPAQIEQSRKELEDIFEEMDKHDAKMSSTEESSIVKACNNWITKIGLMTPTTPKESFKAGWEACKKHYNIK